MLDNVTFIDLVALMRITPDSTVERFGGLINSSFFDASNILGTLKQKGLVDFITQFPSQSAITVTDQGKQLIAEVQQKATVPFDKLDMEVLKKISDGNKNLSDLTSSVNVTAKDLAIHLHKLSTQQFLSYELRNGIINLMLTEKGFLTVKEGMPKQESQDQESQPQTQQQEQPSSTSSAQAASAVSGDIFGERDATLLDMPDIKKYAPPKTDQEVKALEAKILREKRMDRLILAAIIIVIAAIVLYLYIIGII